MTNFNPEGAFKHIEDWEFIAQQRATSTGLAAKIIGGVLAGGAGVAFGIELLGAAAVVWCFKSVWDGFRDTGKKLRLVRECGCNAFVLDSDQFQTYIKQFGEKSVYDELEFVLSTGVDLPTHAQRWFRNQTKSFSPADRTDLKTFSSTNKSCAENPQMITSQNYISTQTINHLDKSEAELNDSDTTFDIISEIASPVRNCFIFGIGGSGKGMLISNAIRKIKAVEPSRTIFYVDPKDSEKEYGYTEGICDVVKRKKCKGLHSSKIVRWIDEVLDEYLAWAKNQESPLLIIDECTIIGKACKTEDNTRIGDTILHISSLGGDAFEKIWIIAQSPFVGGLGIDLTASSQIASLAIISDDNVGVLRQWNRSSLLEKTTVEELRSLFRGCKIPTKKRALYWGGDGNWYSMPVLKNYSNIDRDNNKPVGDALTTEERESLRIATSTNVEVEIKPDEKLIEQLEKTTKSLANFIKSSNQNPEIVLPIIINLLRDNKRNDLLENFGYGWIMIPDPIEALNFWSKTNDISDELLKENWFLHTGQELSGNALKMLKGKLGKN